MTRLTIEMPTGLRGENGRSATGADPMGAADPLRTDGVDESVRVFVRWVGCWAE